MGRQETQTRARNLGTSVLCPCCVCVCVGVLGVAEAMEPRGVSLSEEGSRAGVWSDHPIPHWLL